VEESLSLEGKRRSERRVYRAVARRSHRHESVALARIHRLLLNEHHSEHHGEHHMGIMEKAIRGTSVTIGRLSQSIVQSAGRSEILNRFPVIVDPR